MIIGSAVITRELSSEIKGDLIHLFTKSINDSDGCIRGYEVLQAEQRCLQAICTLDVSHRNVLKLQQRYSGFEALLQMSNFNAAEPFCTLCRYTQPISEDYGAL